MGWLEFLVRFLQMKLRAFFATNAEFRVADAINTGLIINECYN